MNRMQIALTMGMNIIGIPIKVENYRRICNAVYFAEQAGVHISPSRVEWDEQKMRAWSPRTQERCYSHNLLDDVREIQGDLELGFDDSIGWKLDDSSVKKLRNLYQKVPTASCK
ncbi:MAG: hypothetical protein ABH840_03305 [Nanoarchaeota archaeon]